ncbi:hypothetical protein Tco_0617051, partial [Tanacetum coccineum]
MAVIKDCWFQAMQDEIYEFDWLEVWELVPRPIYVMVIALKWIYKVKLDEYGDVGKNKSIGQLVNMSEAEPIPPTSSVTALRIPMIKKGEYDLWSMKMRQYIAITDHILWDIITNGDQATTDPASSSAPKTSLAANARRNNEKALNILLSAIPDRHLLSFHDATNAKTLWT